MVTKKATIIKPFIVSLKKCSHCLTRQWWLRLNYFMFVEYVSKSPTKTKDTGSWFPWFHIHDWIFLCLLSMCPRAQPKPRIPVTGSLGFTFTMLSSWARVTFNWKYETNCLWTAVSVGSLFKLILNFPTTQINHFVVFL